MCFYETFQNQRWIYIFTIFVLQPKQERRRKILQNISSYTNTSYTNLNIATRRPKQFPCFTLIYNASNGLVEKTKKSKPSVNFRRLKTPLVTASGHQKSSYLFTNGHIYLRKANKAENVHLQFRYEGEFEQAWITQA